MRSRPALPLTCVFLLAACGGGGSGSSNTNADEIGTDSLTTNTEQGTEVAEALGITSGSASFSLRSLTNNRKIVRAKRGTYEAKK